MKLLGKPQGIYSLKDSDNNIGSFITKEDVCSILEVVENIKIGKVKEEILLRI